MRRAVAVLLMLPLALRAADDGKEARALLERAITAMGGEKLLSKPHALTGNSSGTIQVAGDTKDVTNRFTVQDLDKLRWEADLGGGTLTLGLAGGKAWISGNNDKANPVPKEHAEALRRSFLALRLAESLVPLKKGWKLSHLGEMEIAGVPCVGIKAKRKGESDVDLHFDKKTLLPRKVEFRFVKPGESAEATLSAHLTGYKKFGERQHFTKLVVELDGTKVAEMDRKDIKETEKADKATFERP